MKSIRFRFLVAALAVMLGAAIVNSQTADATAPPPMHGHGYGMEGHEGHMMGFFAKYLESDRRTAHPNERRHGERALHNETADAAGYQMDQQLKQYVEGTYDEAKVQALVSQQAQTLVQVKVQETRIHNELYQLLTPDQQAKMRSSRPIMRRACRSTCRALLRRLQKNKTAIAWGRALGLPRALFLGASAWSDAMIWLRYSSSSQDGPSLPAGGWFLRRSAS